MNLKTSEARIIMYIKSADKRFCYSKQISTKLNIDYAYVLQILSGMTEKGWLVKDKFPLKTYYSINKDFCPIAAAITAIQTNKKTK